VTRSAPLLVPSWELIDANDNPFPAAAAAGPDRLLLVVVPAAVPLVPANKGNESRFHDAHFS
jgi:hypothetical protein